MFIFLLKQKEPYLDMTFQTTVSAFVLKLNGCNTFALASFTIAFCLSLISLVLGSGDTKIKILLFALFFAAACVFLAILAILQFFISSREKILLNIVLPIVLILMAAGMALYSFGFAAMLGIGAGHGGF